MAPLEHGAGCEPGCVWVDLDGKPCLLIYPDALAQFSPGGDAADSGMVDAAAVSPPHNHNAEGCEGSF